jgi:general stress protein 26
MASETEITGRLWKALRDDRTIMIAVAGDAAGEAQPMTALLEAEDEGPLWIFTAKDTGFAQQVGDGVEAVATFASKGHDLFAALHGEIAPHPDPGVIDRLWSPFVAARYEGGRHDPALLLLRFDLDRAHVWLNETSLLDGVRLLLGADPTQDYAGKTADVAMDTRAT